MICPSYNRLIKCTDCCVKQTKGLSLEEINEIFGDEVVVHITDVGENDKSKLDEDSFRVTQELYETKKNNLV